MREIDFLILETLEEWRGKWYSLAALYNNMEYISHKAFTSGQLLRGLGRLQEDGKIVKWQNPGNGYFNPPEYYLTSVIRRRKVFHLLIIFLAIVVPYMLIVLPVYLLDWSNNVGRILLGFITGMIYGFYLVDLIPKLGKYLDKKLKINRNGF